MTFPLREVDKKDVELAKETLMMLIFSGYSAIYNLKTSSTPPEFDAGVVTFNYCSPGCEMFVKGFLDSSVSPAFYTDYTGQLKRN